MKRSRCKKHISFLLIIFCVGSMATPSIAKGQNTNSATTLPWSVRMAQSEMARQPSGYKVGAKTWDYVIGTVLKGFEHLWNATGDSNYFKYIQTTVDAGVNSAGTITTNGYSFLSYTLDGVNEGKAALFLYQQRGTTKYKTASDTLRKQLSSHPRVSEGGFWHKKTYTNQMWLDGLYMGSPFYAEYGKLFSDTAAFTDVVKQFTILENHTRDTISSLLYHGWDAAKTAQWANPTTGCSPSFWGRAIGWYAMALVDALDYLPANHVGRPHIIAILQRLAVGIKKYQDSIHGTWYQVMDQGDKPDNWREASASCMFVYTLAKGVRLGYIDQSYLAVAQKGYNGILNEFISVNSDSTITLHGICLSAGLDAAPGGARNGSYDYYVNNPGTQPVSNDGKGTGPFIMASVELERIVTMARGWNLVCVPRTQIDYTASVVFPGAYGAMFMYDPDLGDYVEAPILSLGTGIWCYFTSARTMSVYGSSPTVIIPCKAGWNLIGGRETEVNVASLILSAGYIYGAAFMYDTSLGDYVETTTLSPGKGIWLYAIQDCNITVP